MVLYTPLALEEIFPEETADRSDLFEVWVHNKLVLARRGAHGEIQVERLISTEANDYLDPQWLPGSQLTF